jgi:hypothetical protein
MLNVVGKVVNVGSRLTHYIRSSAFVSVLFGTSEAGIQIVRKRVTFTHPTYILRKRQDNDNWLLPCSYFEIEEVIKEYAFAKLCSILKVGMKVGHPDHTFDLVCYEDCIEFYMERCESIVYSTPRMNPGIM